MTFGRSKEGGGEGGGEIATYRLHRGRAETAVDSRLSFPEV